MKKTSIAPKNSYHKSQRNSLQRFLARMPTRVGFKLHDWLRTLKTYELRRIEEDAKNCYDSENPAILPETVAVDLADIALMAYVAERPIESEVDEEVDRLDGLLIGLAVAACIERLERAGWVTITSRMGILLKEPRPYRVTLKGLKEGVWSNDPMTLWVLGANLQKH